MMDMLRGGQILGCIWRYSHLDFLTDWAWGVIKIGGNSDFEVGNLSK